MSDPQNDLLIQEVDDEVRRARLNAFWKAWGKYIIGLAVLVVLIVAGRQYWITKVADDESAASDAYNDVLTKVASGEVDPSGSWAASLDSAAGGYKALGAFRLAAAELEAGNTDAAIAAFDNIASGDADDAMKAIANLQAASLLIQQGDYAGARGRAGLLRGDDAAWDLPAREIIALADLQEGKTDAALAAYRELGATTGLPPTMAQRVGQMIGYLESLGKVQEAVEAPAEAEAVESETDAQAAEGN